VPKKGHTTVYEKRIIRCQVLPKQQRDWTIWEVAGLEKIQIKLVRVRLFFL